MPKVAAPRLSEMLFLFGRKLLDAHGSGPRAVYIFVLLVIVGSFVGHFWVIKLARCRDRDRSGGMSGFYGCEMTVRWVECWAQVRTRFWSNTLCFFDRIQSSKTIPLVLFFCCFDLVNLTKSCFFFVC